MRKRDSVHDVSYVIVEGEKYERCFQLLKDWRDEFSRVIAEQKIQEIRLVPPYEWYDQGFEIDVGFLCEFPHLKALTVAYRWVSDISKIQCLSNLKYLRLLSDKRMHLDFTKFPHLEECSIEWCNGFKSVFQCTGLQDLGIHRLPRQHIDLVGRLKKLRMLSLISCGAESLDSFRSLTKLRGLRLTRFLKLRDCNFLSDLVELRNLWVQTSRGFHSLEPLENLQELETICLDNVGDVESLRPLSKLRKLRGLTLMGRTNLIDKDITSIKRLPKIERIDIQGLSRTGGRSNP